ncbi:MAG: class I SAM-dependent methyltransferase [Bacteroidales bacterium]|nr:class I SAM-dependent methyltransferase [Bacteroidales bacterium]
MYIAHQIKQQLKHTFKAQYWRGFGVHSPFVYHLVRHVITTRQRDKDLRREARKYRRQLESDPRVIDIVDYGTGHDRSRSVADIARAASVNEKYGLMLARIIAEYKPKKIIELGTSLGISTFYLAKRTQTVIDTIEGCPSCAQRAQEQLSLFGVPNVRSHVGTFDAVLPSLLTDNEEDIFVFIDGNHTYEATMRYFDLIARHISGRAILVFDDIHWSPSMTQAWDAIVADPRVMTAVELRKMGLAIFRQGCQKEYYRLRW